MKVSDDVATLVPYVPGKPIGETQREFNLDRVVKLASNENPLGPSARVKNCLASLGGQLHLYPDAGSVDLAQTYAREFNLEPNQLVFGNGSNEVIDLLITLLCDSKDTILTAEKAFIAYKISAQARRVRTKEIPLDSQLKFDLGAMKRFLLSKEGESCRLVFLPNPNNPTGSYFSSTELEDFLQVADHPDRVIVLDEAYFEFVRAKDYPNGQELQRKYSSLYLLRTFSKAYALAGVRLGVLIGSEDTISFLQRIRNPFNVSLVAQRLAQEAILDKEHLHKTQVLTWAGLDYLASELSRLGLKVFPSQANFLLVDLARPALSVYENLLKRGFIVRPVANYGWPHYLRISVGLDDQNQAFVAALKSVLST